MDHFFCATLYAYFACFALFFRVIFATVFFHLRLGDIIWIACDHGISYLSINRIEESGTDFEYATGCCRVYRKDDFYVKPTTIISLF